MTKATGKKSSEIKRARTDSPVHELISGRWSPYTFDERPVSESDRRSLFEAARWAASGFNEQPWRYIVATRDDPERYERLLSCLVDANQAWARHAPMLVLTVVARRLARNDRANGTAEHDLGLATANLVLEATARGLSAHQMGGIVPERVRELYGIPEGFDPLTAIAIGYVIDGTEDGSDDPRRERDRTPRNRRPLSETVFADRWGEPGV